jgi:hypothetical protein
MKNIATIQFRDDVSQDEALVFVRALDGRVALGLSLRTDGDTEVAMPIENAQALIRSLQEAIAIAKEPT